MPGIIVGIDHPKTVRSGFRLTGLDLARGFAVMGMVLVNFVYVLSHDFVAMIEVSPEILETQSPLAQVIVSSVLVGLAGRAAAVFLVLFGIGIMLQAQKARIRKNKDWAQPLMARYGFLILGGLAFIPLWEADILHYIGLYGLLVLPLTRLSFKWLLLVATGILLGAEMGRQVFDYSQGWQPGAIGSQYHDMWSVGGQLRQLFFNGYHPVFPWLSFVIFGLCLGRLDLQNSAVIKRLIAGGLTVAVIGFVAMAVGLSADFFPATTLFILLGLANATWIIALCLWVCRDIEKPDQGSIVNRVIRSMGRLALTHYPGHVVLGLVVILWIKNEAMDLSFEASFAVSLAYLVITGIAGHFWLKGHAQGPLEKLLRYLSTRFIRS